MRWSDEKLRFLFINVLLIFPFIYKRYQRGEFEKFRRILSPYYELEYKKIGLILDLDSRTILSVLDIGANIGQSSYAFRKIFPSAKIFAFEPNPFIFRILTANLNQKNIFLHNFGLGSSDTTTELFVPQYRGVLFTGLGSCKQESSKKYINESKILNFNASRFSILCESIMIKKGDSFMFSPDFIKIDVEGFEDEVLMGLINTIQIHRPIILIECANSFFEINNRLADFSYRSFEYSRSEKKWVPSSGTNLMQLFLP